ncbi:hypothetical protein [Clostridium paraputrificum]|uniref:hypothetical protein n=2 Tax=Clostridiaceae TaxID=31979 RepID=UPI00189C60C9|nr:hypothetical protein [Clostridium paraputrificum]MDB2092886.1 hypothetical protein [Clostridium paraputrificum]
MRLREIIKIIRVRRIKEIIRIIRGKKIRRTFSGLNVFFFMCGNMKGVRYEVRKR